MSGETEQSWWTAWKTAAAAVTVDRMRHWPGEEELDRCARLREHAQDISQHYYAWLLTAHTIRLTYTGEDPLLDDVDEAIHAAGWAVALAQSRYDHGFAAFELADALEDRGDHLEAYAVLRGAFSRRTLHALTEAQQQAVVSVGQALATDGAVAAWQALEQFEAETPVELHRRDSWAALLAETFAAAGEFQLAADSYRSSDLAALMDEFWTKPYLLRRG